MKKTLKSRNLFICGRFTFVMVLAIMLGLTLGFALATPSTPNDTAYAVNDYPLITKVRLMIVPQSGPYSIYSINEVPSSSLDGHSIDEIMTYNYLTGTLTISSWPDWAANRIKSITIAGDEATDFTMKFECDITGNELTIAGGWYNGSRFFMTSDTPHNLELFSLGNTRAEDIFVQGKLNVSVKDILQESERFTKWLKQGGNVYVEDNASLCWTIWPEGEASLWYMLDSTSFHINTTGKVELGAKERSTVTGSYILYQGNVNITKCDGGFYMYHSVDKKHFAKGSFMEDVTSNAISGFNSGIRNDGYYYTLFVEPNVVKTPKNITFNANGGSNEMSQQITDEDGNYTLPSCGFEKVGNKFAGWAIGSADATPVMPENSKIQVETDTTIYATWTETTKGQVIYLDGQDGANNFVEGNYNAGDTVELLDWADTSFVAPEGKVFDRWHVIGYDTKIDNTHYTIEDDGEGNGENITVAPLWVSDPSVWTITYQPGDGTGDNIVKYVKKGEEYQLILNQFTAPSGKEFAGWEVDGQNKAPLTSVEVSSDQYYMALWHTLGNEMDVCYNEDEAICVGDKLEPSLVEAYFNFDDNAKEKANPFELKYYVYYPGGIIEEVEINVDTQSFDKGRYIIRARWAEDETKMGEMIIWSGYTVSFNANSGTGEMNSLIWWKDDGYVLPVNTFTAPTGKQFKGWALTSNGEVIDATSIAVNADTALYAIWEDIPAVTYTITFNSNNGTGTMNPVQYAGTYTLPSCSFTAPSGKQFKGWALSPSGNVIANNTTDVNENITLYAIWEDAPVDPVDPVNPVDPGQGESGNNGNNQNGTNSIDDKANKPLGGGAIAGIVIAIVVVLGSAGFCVYWFVFRKKKGNSPAPQAEENKEEPVAEEPKEESAEEEVKEEVPQEEPNKEEDTKEE